MISGIIIAIISILILISIIIILCINKPRQYGLGLLLPLYCYNLLSEGLMLITALNGIHNHFIANIHSLLSGISIFFILNNIWNRIALKKMPTFIFPVVLIVSCIIWAIDNFIIHKITLFNPFSQAIISTINITVVIYLLNVLLFIKRNNNADKIFLYIIIGFLVCCFANILVDTFFNKYLNLPTSFYRILGSITQIFGTISHFFILLGVIWISKAAKYSLR